MLLKFTDTLTINADSIDSAEIVENEDIIIKTKSGGFYKILSTDKKHKIVLSFLNKAQSIEDYLN